MSSVINNTLKNQFGAPRGVVRLRIYNAAGELLRYEVRDNLVVDSGRALQAALLGAAVNRFGVGTNGDAAAPADVAPLEDQFAKAFAGVTYPDTRSVEFAFTLEANEFNGNTLREFALLAYVSPTYTLFARQGGHDIAKTDQVRIEGTWTITF